MKTKRVVRKRLKRICNYVRTNSIAIFHRDRQIIKHLIKPMETILKRERLDVDYNTSNGSMVMK